MSTTAETDVIKPYAGGHPGGPRPSKDVVIPYEGGHVVLTPDAQVAGKAAMEFAAANPIISAAIEGKKSANVLDPETQSNLNELRQTMMMSPPKASTVVNLHPWPLQFGSGNPLLRGITIPACPAGQVFAHHHIRAWRHDAKYNESGTRDFKAILPIQLAGEFVREFSNTDNDGGGVLIYEGDSNPSKVDMVETYNPMGRMITIDHPDKMIDPEGHTVDTIVRTPIRRKFKELLAEEIARRNEVYLRKVRRADHDWKLPDGRGKHTVTSKHLLMAEVLFAEGKLSKMPEWNLSTRLDEGLSDSNCPACGAPRKSGAYKCLACANILNPLEAYRDFAIEFDHAKMAMLTSDELDEAELIKLEREEKKSSKSGKKKS